MNECQPVCSSILWRLGVWGGGEDATRQSTTNKCKFMKQVSPHAVDLSISQHPMYGPVTEHPSRHG